MGTLRDTLANGGFAVTSEIAPPKGVAVWKHLDDAQPHLEGNVCAVNVTDNQSAVMRMGSMATCHLLLERDLEPVYQLVCRDRNRLALQSDLLSAWALGIENVLCITGDHNFLGDHAESKPVFDLDSVQLLKAATALNGGHDLAGHELDGEPDFFCGAVVTPVFDPIELQTTKMRKKIDAGARFFQTQAVYDAGAFSAFMEQVSDANVPVMAGIVVLKSAAMARFMNENIAGVSVPEGIIQELADTKKEDRKTKSVEITARIIREVRPLCQGIHLMPLGWDDLIPDIVSQSGLQS